MNIFVLDDEVIAPGLVRLMAANQPRDRAGRWTEVGGGAPATPPSRKASGGGSTSATENISGTDVEARLLSGSFVSGSGTGVGLQGVNNVGVFTLQGADGVAAQAVVKTISSKDMRAGGVPKGRDIEHERAAMVLNKAMGNYVDIPPTVERTIDAPGPPLKKGGRVQVTHFEANEGPVHWWRNGSDANAATYAAAGEGLRKVALFDAVIGNTDRHAGNLLVRSDAATKAGAGRFVAIDHGLAFPTGRSARELPVGNYDLHRVAVKASGGNLNRDERKVLDGLSQNEKALRTELRGAGLRPAQIDGVFARVNAMRASGKWINAPGSYSDERLGIDW